MSFRDFGVGQRHAGLHCCCCSSMRIGKRSALQPRDLLVGIGDPRQLLARHARPRCARTAGRPSARAPRAGSRRAGCCGSSARPWPSPRCVPGRTRAAPRRRGRARRAGRRGKRASRIAWPAPFEPRGTIGWRGVAEQRDAAEAPARQRILVDHRIGEHARRSAGSARRRRASRSASRRTRRRSRRAGRGRSSRAPPASSHSSSATQLTSWRPSAVDVVADRIDHHLADASASRPRTMRRAAQERRVQRHAAPHVDARPARRALVRMELAANRRVDAVAGDRQRRLDLGQRLRPAGSCEAQATRVAPAGSTPTQALAGTTASRAERAPAPRPAARPAGRRGGSRAAASRSRPSGPAGSV